MEKEQLIKEVLNALSEVGITNNRKISADIFFSITFMSEKNLKNLYKKLTGRVI